MATDGPRQRYRRHGPHGHNRLGILWIRFEGRLAFCEECGRRLPFEDKPTAGQLRRDRRRARQQIGIRVAIGVIALISAGLIAWASN